MTDFFYKFENNIFYVVRLLSFFFLIFTVFFILDIAFASITCSEFLHFVHSVIWIVFQDLLCCVFIEPYLCNFLITL